MIKSPLFNSQDKGPRYLLPLEGATFINLVKIISRAEVLKNFPVLISACLLDISCRYDGRGSGSPGIISMASSINIIPFCPEQLGGLSTPRPPARIVGGDGGDLFTGKARVINSMGEDVTDAFRRGAEESLRLARLTKAKIALLKDISPSCGLSTPYCDSPGGLGVGVTATLLNSSGIRTMEIHKGDGFPTQEFIALFEELYGISPVQPGLSC